MKFNINRYIQILKKDTIGFKQHYLSIILAAFLAPLLTIFFKFAPVVVANFWSVPLVLLIVLIPFVLYEDIYHKTKGVSFALLPASALEKFLSALTHCLIIVPIILVAVTFLVFGFIEIIGYKEVVWDFDRFFWNYANVISGQAFLFWVVFWFRKNKKRNGLFTIIGIIMLLALASRIIMFSSLFEDLIRIAADWIARYINIFRYIVFPLTAWCLSYYKFTRQQV